MKNKLIHVGWFARVHGLEGELLLQLKYAWKGGLHEVGRVFIYVEGTYVPYVIRQYEVEGGYVRVKLLGVNTRSEAYALRSKRIFVDEALVYYNDALYDEKMVGCMVKDSKQGVLGRVVALAKNAMQSCLCVDYNGKELFIPLHDHFVKGVDGGEIRVVLPSDYVDILLGNKD